MRSAYRTVAHTARARITEHRSVFIAVCAPVTTEEEAIAFLRGIRAEFPDATHHVPAWILGGDLQLQKHSDDGEPQGTAGLPVLESLHRQGIEDAAIVVVRYYGGTPLGTGGLVRAYGQVAAMAVELAGIVDRIPCSAFRMTVRYGDLERVQRRLRAIGTGVGDLVCGIDAEFIALVPLGSESRFRQEIDDLTAGSALVEPQGMDSYSVDAQGLPVPLAHPRGSR